MSKPETEYTKAPMAFTFDDIESLVQSRKFGFVETPLIRIPFDHIVLDEIHLLLRITDVLLANLIEDAMEWDDKSDFLKKKGEAKGVHLHKLVQTINSCGVTFTIWEKKRWRWTWVWENGLDIADGSRKEKNCLNYSR